MRYVVRAQPHECCKSGEVNDWHTAIQSGYAQGDPTASRWALLNFIVKTRQHAGASRGVVVRYGS